MTVSVPAFAKINLFLDITSVRDDGYHNIISYMQSVTLADTITVSYTPSEKKTITVTCNNPSVPLSNDNLVYKAADIFPNVCGSISIHIEKNIPMEAGLAGGSSDAAATLVALNSLTGYKVTESELVALGANLGADVPFCIKGKAALAEGIGEILTPIAPMPCLPIVIAKKGKGMSTPAAYKALDEKYSKFKNYVYNSDKLKVLLNDGSKQASKLFCQGLFNIFEPIVAEHRGEIDEIKTLMKSCGAVGAMMSGSGTSVFGIFDKEDDAIKAINALKNTGADAHLCYPVK